jgi:hypothetical protein
MFKLFIMRIARHNYKVVDDDFEEDVNANGVIHSVIKVYEQRGLPVVPNIIRVLLYLMDNGSPLTRHMQPLYAINWNKRETPEYERYAKEVDKEIAKYLVLL